MDNIKNIKRNIFNIFGIARLIFNDYYNGIEKYSEQDLDDIKLFLLDLEEQIIELRKDL